MLTPQFPWNDLCYDLKFETTQHLISHPNFPQSLRHLALSDMTGHHLANEPGIWRQAILLYFPAILAIKKPQMNGNPKALFIELYQNLLPLLAINNLHFSDFVAAVINRTLVADYQMPALQGLLFSAGHPTLNRQAVDLSILEEALLFAAAIGNHDFFTTHLEQNRAPFSHGALSKAFFIAAYTGHQRIFNLLLTHTHPTFDATTLRDALLAGAGHGHIRIVAPLLQPPYLRLISFSLKKVVELAIQRNYPELLTLLLRDNQHLRYGSEIRTSVILAAKQNLDSIIAKVYQLAPAHFSDNTICKLIRIAATNGNEALVTLFLQHPTLAKSPSTLLESIQIAMNGGHPSIALLLLHQGKSALRTYIKRDLITLATRLGYRDIVEALTDSPDPLTQAFSKLSLAAPKSNTISGSEYTPGFANSRKGLRISGATENQPATTIMLPGFT